MKADIILNGTTKVILIPETDIEKLVVEQLSKTDVTSFLIDKQTQILDKIIHNGLVITTKNLQNLQKHE
tara:strand:- start:2877 stop:3083 length:207 start_codon:yes stop_codon:yes gene_type:complete